jgi:ATP adenylyltransferase
MDFIWTPWRYQYITAPEEKGACIFCVAAQSADDERTLVVHRAERNFVMLNRYPYTAGHLMVVPYDHVSALDLLAPETLCEQMLLARDAEHHLREIYHPEGLNIGMNIGKCAGAGIADHLHLHVLPRWTGDTNFMTVVGETRMVPEELTTTWQKLRKAWGKA